MTFNHGVRGSIPRWITIFFWKVRDSLRGVAQMGARVLWEHEVAGSIPVTPTICFDVSVLVCGSGSVVERHLAKVNVASSNLVFRSAGVVQW